MWMSSCAERARIKSRAIRTEEPWSDAIAASIARRASEVLVVCVAPVVCAEDTGPVLSAHAEVTPIIPAIKVAAPSA
jgi:hypothetical protein